MDRVEEEKYKMRTFRELPEQTRIRLTTYIKNNLNVSAPILAEDLQILKTSIITIKGNLTRKNQKG